MKSRKQYYLHGLYSYIKEIGDRAINSGMDIIIWGYSKGGAFARYLLENYDQRLRIAYIIDEYMQIPANSFPRIYRPSILQYIDSKNYVLLSTIKNYKVVCDYASEYGFSDKENMFDLRTEIGVSFIDYLQITNNELDFSYVTEKERPDIYSNPIIRISTPFEMTSLDRVFAEISELEDDIRFFDYGCGKGQILFSAYMYGIDNASGIELVPEIANQAVKNMKVLEVPAKVICGDATTYYDIDDINVFYFNNPFMGGLFEKVITNIETSLKRKYRRIHMIYLNPACHKTVINNGVFELKRQIYVDVGDPLANFYCNE